MQFIKRHVWFLAAGLYLGAFWFALDVVFQGDVVANLIALVHTPEEACTRHEDGSRVCMPLPEASATQASSH